MKILHIIPFGIFTINYVNAFNKYDVNSHTFWMYGYSKEHEVERNIYFENDINVMRIEKGKYYSFEKEYSTHDIILFLCIPEEVKLLNLVFECYQKCPKPYILSPWGRDTDRTSDIYKMDKAKWMPMDQMKKWLIKNSACIASTQRLYEVLQELYHARSPRKFFGNNLLAFSSNKLSDLDIMKNHDKLNIMIGHRGTDTARHLEIFNIIKPYKEKIGNIICPLSYGVKSYIKKVQRVGKIKFWNQWKPLIEWMNIDEYMQFLNENVDVAIFASQFEGASTIYELIYMGKTIYLNEHSETVEILDELGVSYYKLSPECKGFQLKTISEVEKAKNRRLMEKYGSAERFNEQWMVLINDCYQNWAIDNNKEGLT